MIRRKGKGEGQRRAAKAKLLLVPGVDAVAGQHLRQGANGLEAFFPGGSGPHANKPVNLQFLSHFDEETMQAIAQGWTIWNASDATPNSRDTRMQRLTYGFVEWMRETKKAAPNITDIDTALIGEFADFIGKPASAGYVAGRKLRLSLLHAIEEPLFRLSLSDTWQPRLSPDLRRLVEPFGLAKTERKRAAADAPAPRPKTKTIIGRSTYDRLWDEAATRVEADMALHEAQLDELDRLIDKEVALSPATAASPAALATWLIRTYPGGIRGYGRNDPRGIYRRTVSRAQQDAAEALVHPTMEKVLPFIYLTTAFFALNAQVALGMTLDDYRLDEVPGGARRLRIFPDKPRADDRQRHAVAETADPANPARFLPYLERRTAHLRRLVATTLKRHAFLYFEHSKRYPNALLETNDTFGRRMQDLAKACGAGHLSLRQLRLTTLDVVHDITNGNILATRAVANHKTVSTTHTDYRTEAMRNRYEELHGDALQEWERFWGSGGKVDAISRPPRIDRTAATPGYICRAPHQSPVPGEKGRLCQAYGHCPACPLAVVPHRSPHAFRCLQGLLARIEEAEQEMDAASYSARWAEVKVWLVAIHLEMFGPETRAAAEHVVVPLMPKLD